MNATLKNATSVFLLKCLILLILSSFLVAQSPRGRFSGGQVHGKVIDAVTGVPVEYASIILRSLRDTTRATGTITDKEGKFILEVRRPGRYRLEVDFIGYKRKIIPELRVTPRQVEVDVGEIQLDPVAIQAEEVEVVGERAPVTFHIDKKVVSVEGQLTAASGTAVDVLENVPSVTVDIEGNVALRGSSNFTVLIDGVPSILDPADALQQIPASSIEKIEIITNPSAKYDPEGTAGIINVIMKKGKKRGINGITTLKTGMDDKYGGDALFNYQKGRIQFYIGGDYNHQFFPGSSREENQTIQQDSVSFIASEGTNRRGRISYGLRAGLNWKLFTRDNLTLGIRAGDRSHRRTAQTDYDQWNDGSALHLLYANKSERERQSTFYSLTMDYKHRFPKENHELSAQLVMNQRDSDESTLNELYDTPELITEGRQTTEVGPGSRVQFRLDYAYPFNKKSKLETGYQGQMNSAEDDTRLLDYDPLIQRYVEQTEYSHQTRYDRTIHALYGIYATSLGRLGMQGGFRGEYTFRKVKLLDTGEQYTIDRWDYFPSVHLSYQTVRGQQLMTSYSRRIQRPRGWYLEPFETWMDAYNVRTGNPDLQPEYIDSYELGLQTFWKKNVISLEGYYRITHNRVERVRSVYAENITLHTLANVGKDYALGAELMLNANPRIWWNINYMANVYDYRIEGNLLGRPFQRSSFNWNLRFNNIFKFSQATQAQLNVMYNSPSVSSQGKREGFTMVHLAIKHDIIPQKLTLTFLLRDLFSTGKFEFTSSGPNFNSYTYFDRKAPIVLLNVRYIFNNYKPERRRSPERSLENGDEDDEF
ncbi:MAG: TonB-dependent receptor [Calditrichaeota bacterium]|nr:MAG: TonB-dependent receptor [Calditrichota bacterium]